MQSQTVNIALDTPVHKDLKRIANRKGWKLRHAAKEAVAALKEKEARPVGHTNGTTESSMSN